MSSEEIGSDDFPPNGINVLTPVPTTPGVPVRVASGILSGSKSEHVNIFDSSL